MKYENKLNLPAFIELDIKEKIRDINIISQADDFVFQFIEHENFRILKHRIEFEQNELNTELLNYLYFQLSLVKIRS